MVSSVPQKRYKSKKLKPETKDTVPRVIDDVTKLIVWTARGLFSVTQRFKSATSAAENKMAKKRKGVIRIAKTCFAETS